MNIKIIFTNGDNVVYENFQRIETVIHRGKVSELLAKDVAQIVIGGV